MNLQSLFCGILLFLSITALIISCLAFTKKDLGVGVEHFNLSPRTPRNPSPHPGPTPGPLIPCCCPTLLPHEDVCWLANSKASCADFADAGCYEGSCDGPSSKAPSSAPFWWPGQRGYCKLGKCCPGRPTPGPSPKPSPKPCKGTCAPLGPFGAAAYCDHKTKKCEYCNKEGICVAAQVETCTASNQNCDPVRGYGPQTCDLTEPCLACKNSDWCNRCADGLDGPDTCPIKLPAASNWSPNSSPNSGGDLVITRRLCVGNNTAYCPRPGAQRMDGCGNQPSRGPPCPNNVSCPPDRSGHYPDTRFTPCERCNHGQCIRCKPKFKFKSYPDGTTKCECTPSSCPWNYSCRMEKPYNGTCQPRGCKFNGGCAGAPSSASPFPGVAMCCPDNHGKMHACCH